MKREIFNNGELKIIVMGIERMVEDMEDVSKNPNYPFTPEARKDMNDILVAARSTKKKLENCINNGVAFSIDPYEEGDEKEFLTKQS